MEYFNKLFYNDNITIFKIVKLLFYSFPVILFFSSFFLNLYITLFTFLGIIAIYRLKIKFNLSLIDYLILILFILNFIATLNNISNLGYEKFIKSILNLRFFLLIWVVRNLLLNQIVNVKLLSIISLISSILLCLDIFLQHLIGYDIFKFQPFDNRFNGFFEHEAIAGSYLQKFLLLSILVIFLSNLKKITKAILIIFALNIIGLGVLLSFDRMPFFILLFSLFLIFIFLKNFRIIFMLNLIIIITLFFYSLKNYENLRNRYEHLNRDINFHKILNLSIIKKNFGTYIQNQKNTDFLSKEHLFYGDYSKLFRAAYYVSLQNNFIGSGHKSFINECIKLRLANISCNNHPHNLYLEVLVNTGIIGLFILIIILKLISIKIIKQFFKNCLNKDQYIILMLFSVYFIAEFFPLRTFGSIFTTFNGSIFWFFFGILTYLDKLNVKKINK
jgi:O-antigen ligase